MNRAVNLQTATTQNNDGYNKKARLADEDDV